MLFCLSSTSSLCSFRTLRLTPSYPHPSPRLHPLVARPQTHLPDLLLARCSAHRTLLLSLPCPSPLFSTHRNGCSSLTTRLSFIHLFLSSLPSLSVCSPHDPTLSTKRPEKLSSQLHRSNRSTLASRKEATHLKRTRASPPPPPSLHTSYHGGTQWRTVVMAENTILSLCFPCPTATQAGPVDEVLTSAFQQLCAHVGQSHHCQVVLNVTLNSQAKKRLSSETHQSVYNVTITGAYQNVMSARGALLRNNPLKVMASVQVGLIRLELIRSVGQCYFDGGRVYFYNPQKHRSMTHMRMCIAHLFGSLL